MTMPEDPQPAPERRRDRRRALVPGLAVAALVRAVPLLAQGYRELRRDQGVDQVALQFAGGREAACRVVQPGAAGCPVPAAEAERSRPQGLARSWSSILSWPMPATSSSPSAP